MNEETQTITRSDKQLAARVGKVLSHHTIKSGFSTALVYEPDNTAEAAHGSLYFVIDIGSPSPLSPDIAYNLIDIVKEEYYSDLDLSASESFENALKAANAELGAIAKEGEKDWIGKLNIIIAAMRSREMHIVQRGTAELHLLREGNMTNLSKGMYAPGETYRPEETLVNLIEGELSPGDKVVVSTSELFYYISVEKLKRLLDGNTPAQVAKKLANMLEQEEEINRTSVLVAEFNQPELIAQEEETEPNENWVGEPSRIKPKTGRLREMLPGLNKQQTVAEALEQQHVEQTTPRSQVAKEAEIEEEVEGPAARSAFTPPHQEIEPDDIIIDEAEEMPRRELRLPQFSLPTMKLPRFSGVSIKTDSKQLQAAGKIVFKILRGLGLLVLSLVDVVISGIGAGVKFIRKRPHGDKILVGVVAVLVIAIVGSTLALAQGYSGNISTRKATSALTEAQQKRDTAQASLIYEDVVKSRELLAEAYTLAESATHNKKTQAAAAILLTELTKQLDEVSGVHRFQDVQPLVDFDVLAPQLTASVGPDAKVKIGEVVVLGGNVYTLDPDNNKIYKFKTSSGEAALINSLASTSKKLSTLSAASDSEMIFYTVPPSVYNLNLTNNSMTPVALDSGSWNNSTKFIAYTDKLYLLDPANNQIWKYKKVPEGYSQIASYFEINTGINLSGALDFAIDGNVFMLMPGNVVDKYTGGEKVSFTLGSLPSTYPAIGNITRVYADPNSQLYVLDVANKRVVRFDKEGTYLGQYIYDNINDPQDLYVDEAGGAIYLSSGTAVYRLPLNPKD
ncbi:MAG: hypothetical protein V1826_03135 [bacterium]